MPENQAFTTASRWRMEPGRPETWPPLCHFQEHWEDRFGGEGYRVSEYVVARMEFEHVAGFREIDRPDGHAGALGRKLTDAVEYWRLFWTFDGPLYKPYEIEFEARPGGGAWRAETRRMRLIPEHERRTMVQAYWAPQR